MATIKWTCQKCHTGHTTAVVFEWDNGNRLQACVPCMCAHVERIVASEGILPARWGFAGVGESLVERRGDPGDLTKNAAALLELIETRYNAQPGGRFPPEAPAPRRDQAPRR